MKTVIISGYFNPLHGGHLDYIEAAKKLGDRLVVIVNNDIQQKLKKGKIILDENNRLRLISALRDVDEAILSVDSEPPVTDTLKIFAKEHPNDQIIFANGGDRDGNRVVPETDVCDDLGIVMKFGVGSHEVIKRDSSTRINQHTGKEK